LNTFYRNHYFHEAESLNITDVFSKNTLAPITLEAKHPFQNDISTPFPLGLIKNMSNETSTDNTMTWIMSG